MSGGHFGPGVIGQEQYDAEQRVIERHAHIFGPGVLDPAPATPPAAAAPAEGITATVATAAADEPVTVGALSINQLKVELEANPDAFDKLMQGEFARPEGPRKGALRELLANERAHATPRAEVIETLEHALGRGAAE